MKRLFLLIPAFLVLSSLWTEGKGEKNNIPADRAPMVMVYLEGEVLVNGNPAEEGQVIPTGATVDTGADGYCEIVFGGQNIFRVEPGTITRLDIGTGAGTIELQKGSLALLLDKLEVLGLGDKPFTFATPVTTAGIRGTAFYVKVESPESVYFCCCNGTIDLTDSRGGNPLTLDTKHHHAVRYTRQGQDYSFADAPLLYHDDREMDNLAEKINVTIPWSGSAYAY